MLKLVQSDPDAVDASPDSETAEVVDLDVLCQIAAQQMLATALLAERQAYLDAHANDVDQTGRRLVIGNGYARQREVVTGAGPVTVEAPRVNDKRPDEKFSSQILPAYMRRSPKVTEVLPVLYLRGLSTGDFAPTLSGFLGSEAGLSASTITRLTEAWQVEHSEWAERDLSDRDYVYWWADGIHFNVRLEEDRLCCLVIVGVRPDGTKELITLADGYREDTESWLDVLRSLKTRGLTGPNLAVGDGALGFWGALREVFPATGEQRCWVHYAEFPIMPTSRSDPCVEPAQVPFSGRAARHNRPQESRTRSDRGLCRRPFGPGSKSLHQGFSTAGPYSCCYDRAVQWLDQPGLCRSRQRESPVQRSDTPRIPHNLELGIMDLMPISA